MKSQYSLSWLTLLPLAGAAIGITYDVGFFLTIGFNYFSMFSLSEHVVFSLEAIPLAIIVLQLSALVVSFSVEYIERAGELNHATLGAAGKIFFYFPIPLAILLLAAAYHFGLAGLTWSAASILLCAVYLAVEVYRGRPTVPRVIMRYVVVMFAPLMMALSYGLLTAMGRIMSTDHQTITLADKSKINVRVFRSGERGVLFYDPESKTTNLIGWNNIYEISGSLPVATNKFYEKSRAKGSNDQ